MTAPYSARIAELITGSLRHEATVTVHPQSGAPFPLNLEGTDLSITFDESWSPYVQARLGCSIPASAQLDQLDPRTLCRLTFAAGYGYPDGPAEVFDLANLLLRSRDVRRPASTLSLTAESDESLTQDYVWRTSFPAIPTTGINEATSWMLEYSLIPQGYQLSSEFAAGAYATSLAELEITFGDRASSILEEIATRTGQRIYCDENRIWRIRARPTLSGTPAHVLEVGANGTLTNTAAGLSRNDWANEVALEYYWRDSAGVDQRVLGTASVTSGPHSTGTVGRKTYSQRRNKRVSQTTANNSAAVMLRNLATRGRSLSLTAIAAYWLRPGDTISVTLPTGEPENHFIRSITFHPLRGLMDITTRQPVDVTITSGE